MSLLRSDTQNIKRVLWYMYKVTINRNAGSGLKDVAGLYFFLPEADSPAAAAAAAAAAASAFNFSSLCSMKSLYSSADRLKRRWERRKENLYSTLAGKYNLKQVHLI